MPDTTYPAEVERLIVDHITHWRKETIAARLGKSRSAIRAWCWRHGISARKRHLLTSGQAARLLGVSCQWLTALARAGRIPARREPGGRWWLFPERVLSMVPQPRRDRESLRRAGRIGARLRWRCGDE